MQRNPLISFSVLTAIITGLYQTTKSRCAGARSNIFIILLPVPRTVPGI